MIQLLLTHSFQTDLHIKNNGESQIHGFLYAFALSSYEDQHKKNVISISKIPRNKEEINPIANKQHPGKIYYICNCRTSLLKWVKDGIGF